jgi:DNA-binding LytR/AlgR family response regulator
LLKSKGLHFVKVSRSSAVNLSHLTEVNSEFIKVGYLEIPYSDSYKKDIIHQWKNYLGE